MTIPDQAPAEGHSGSSPIGVDPMTMIGRCVGRWSRMYVHTQGGNRVICDNLT